MSRSRQKRKYGANPLKIPNNDKNFCKRGFFTYGIFKEGQLAHAKIKEYIDYIEDDEINREIRLRDGVPFITNQVSRKLTKGQKIFFIEGKEKEAYEIISNTEPEQFYEWGIIEIDGKKYNVLIGVNPQYGYIAHYDDNYNYIDNFDGKNDPYFSRVIPFIRKDLDNLKHDENEMFRLQMYYMLLWSAIDRYCSLKYDVSKRQGDYLEALSEDQVFTNALESTYISNRNIIFSTNWLCPFVLNPKKPRYAINFYYTLRSNVIHRGKDENNKKEILRSSLEELLEIFEKMIEETFE